MHTTERGHAPAAAAADAGYRHAATFYEGPDGLLEQLLPFVRGGVACDEPTLVVLAAAKIDALRAALGSDASRVSFADMGEVGANPALIIPVWEEFVGAHPGRRTRGIGEPISPERRADELTECQHHERLLNPALVGSQLFLVCPYDTQALPRGVVDEAQRSHPLVYDRGRERRSTAFDARTAARGFADAPLPTPEVAPEEFAFTRATLGPLRAFVRAKTAEIGLDGARAHGLLTAVSELATNSVRHGGGSGVLRVWRSGDRFVCEVADAGRIDDPLVDRRRPTVEQIGGRGLWLANRLCDLVQLRSLPTGVVARLHMRLH